jgi:hypothetical protein
VARQTETWPQKVSLEVLVNNKEPKLQSLATTRGPEDWTNLLHRVHLMVAQIETGLFLFCDPGSWICSPNWCGYFWTCSYSIKRK